MDEKDFLLNLTKDVDELVDKFKNSLASAGMINVGVPSAPSASLGTSTSTVMPPGPTFSTSTSTAAPASTPKLRTNLPWWRGVRGLMRNIWYGKHPDNPDYHEQKLSLKRYIQIKESVLNFCENIKKEIIVESTDQLENLFKDFATSLISLIVSKYMHWAAPASASSPAPTPAAASSPAAPWDTGGKVDASDIEALLAARRAAAAPSAGSTITPAAPSASSATSLPLEEFKDLSSIFTDEEKKSFVNGNKIKSSSDILATIKPALDGKVSFETPPTDKDIARVKAIFGLSSKTGRTKTMDGNIVDFINKLKSYSNGPIEPIGTMPNDPNQPPPGNEEQPDEDDVMNDILGDFKSK